MEKSWDSHINRFKLMVYNKVKSEMKVSVMLYQIGKTLKTDLIPQ